MLKVLAAIALGVSLQLSVQAETVTLGGNLTPGAEVSPPGADTTGFNPTGFILGSLNTDTGLFSWLLSFDGLTGNALAAHFHGPAAAGSEAGIQIDIGDASSAENSAGEAVDVFLSGIGSANGSFVGKATLSAGQMSDLLAGLWYANVHTEKNPGGEIRGQLERTSSINPVPVPAAVWLLGSAFGGLGFLRRRAG